MQWVGSQNKNSTPKKIIKNIRILTALEKNAINIVYWKHECYQYPILESMSDIGTNAINISMFSNVFSKENQDIDNIGKQCYQYPILEPMLSISRVAT